MANYSTLKAAIADVIKQNGNNEITGNILQQSLLAMVNSLGAYYQFVGVATPSITPGTPDQNVYYIGGAGVYSNFGTPITIRNGHVGVFYYNGQWNSNTIAINELLKGSFIEGRGGIKELYIFGDIQIDDLHLLYRGENNCRVVFFYNGAAVAETIIIVPTTGPWPSTIYLDYGGIIPIYRTSTIGSTNEIIGYICVDWSNWNIGTNVVVAALTENAYNVVCSPTIYSYLLSLVDQTEKIESIIKKDVNGIIGENNVTGTTNPRLLNLQIPTGQKIIIRVDCGNRVYNYANVYIIDGGNAKIIQAIVGKGLHTIEYVAVGEITLIAINFNGITTGDDASLIVYIEDSIGVKNNELYNAYLRFGKYGVAQSPINPILFEDPAALASALNTAFENYATLCKCSVGSFYPFFSSDISAGRFVFKINHNFRETVITDEMTPEMMCAFINYQFTRPINRFNDATLNTSDNINASINTLMRIGEPSAIVSDDMQTLYIYCSSLFRYKSTDGINFELDHKLTINGVEVSQENPEYLMHVNVNYIDGVYYLIGTHANFQPLVLWTSTDGWNFTKVGTLLEIGDEINANHDAIGNFGNTFLVKEPKTGTWYLYYEMTKSVGAVDWEICVATCPNIMAERSAGKYGVWTQFANNPTLPAKLDTYTSRTTGAGNPNIVCGLNNRPIRCNGKYYMYIHGNSSWFGNSLWRYYSTDLLNWVYDGIVYNNRDVPSAGESAPGNGDQCIVEFKGRTLLFYTWDINDYPRPEYVKLTIDDRPILQMLELQC